MGRHSWRSAGHSSTGARTYVELYGAYTECEAVYGVDHLLALGESLDESDRAQLATRPAGHRLGRLHHRHPPAVGRRARACSLVAHQGPGRRPASERLRNQVLSPERQLAAFDLENTLIASNVVTSYSWLATRRLSTADRAPLRRPHARRGARRCWPSTARTAATSCGRSTAATRAPRSSSSTTTRPSTSARLLLAGSFPAAIRRVREHRAAGHRTVLITGALDVVVEPLRPLFDDIVCAELGTEVDRDGAGCYRPARRRPTHGRGSGRSPRRLLRRRGPRRWPRPSPTPTPPRTCRCSRPSASRWRSTPRPGWPSSPASGAGWSSTSATAPGFARTASLPHRPPPRSDAACNAARPEAPDEGADRSTATSPGSARRRLAGRVRRRRRGPVGPLRLRDIDPPDLPGAGLGAPARPAWPGICGSDLATVDGRQLALLRADRVVPVRARPRGGRRPTPTAAGSVVGARARLRRPGHRPRVRRLRRRPTRQLRAPRLRRTSSPACRPASAATPAAGGPPSMVAHPSQLHAVPDELDDEAAVHGRAHRLRGARRAGRAACSPTSPSP